MGWNEQLRAQHHNNNDSRYSRAPQCSARAPSRSLLQVTNRVCVAYFYSVYVYVMLHVPAALCAAYLLPNSPVGFAILFVDFAVAWGFAHRSVRDARAATQTAPDLAQRLCWECC